jgi:hypothetical protein
MHSRAFDLGGMGKNWSIAIADPPFRHDLPKAAFAKEVVEKHVAGVEAEEALAGVAAEKRHFFRCPEIERTGGNLRGFGSE